MERDCGECDLCCTLMEVDSLRKPEGRACTHLGPAGGCGIHGSHPHDCRSFRCGWLTTPQLGPEWRPLEARFILTRHVNGSIVVHADEHAPPRWREPAFLAHLKNLAARVLREGGHVLLHAGPEYWVIFPEDEVPIAPFRIGDRVKTGYRTENDAEMPVVTVLRDGRRTEYGGRPFRRVPVSEGSPPDGGTVPPATG